MPCLDKKTVKTITIIILKVHVFNIRDDLTFMSAFFVLTVLIQVEKVQVFTRTLFQYWCYLWLQTTSHIGTQCEQLVAVKSKSHFVRKKELSGRLVLFIFLS